MRLLMLTLTLSGAFLTSCASKVPTPPGDPRLNQLRTIAYLPHYGMSLDAPTQDKLAADWAERWGYVRQGVAWLSVSQSARRLQSADATRAWSEQEKAHMQTGLLSADAVKAICGAVQADGFMQVTVFHAQAGSGASLFLFRPWFGAGGETAGAARLGAVLYGCKEQEELWRAADETSYSGNYTQLQFIQYSLGNLSSSIPPK